MAQTLFICLIYMYEVVWCEYQPQPWCYDIMSTPQVDLYFQIWGQLGRCNGIRVHPYALETAYQWLKLFVYVYHGCMKQSEKDVSLNHDITASFHSTSDPEAPNLGPTWPFKWYKGAPSSPWDSIPKAQTLCICLLWMSEAVWSWYQPQLWLHGFIFTSRVTLSPQIWGQPGQCNGIRMQPYALERAYQWLKHSAYA